MEFGLVSENAMFRYANVAQQHRHNARDNNIRYNFFSLFFILSCLALRISSQFDIKSTVALSVCCSAPLGFFARWAICIRHYLCRHIQLWRLISQINISKRKHLKTNFFSGSYSNESVWRTRIFKCQFVSFFFRCIWNLRKWNHPNMNQKKKVWKVQNCVTSTQFTGTREKFFSLCKMNAFEKEYSFFIVVLVP